VTKSSWRRSLRINSIGNASSLPEEEGRGLGGSFEVDETLETLIVPFSTWAQRYAIFSRISCFIWEVYIMVNTSLMFEFGEKKIQSKKPSSKVGC